ncbi:MAG: rhomboid family intramembrane serine protease [candidate division NC10 bacterium]|nr:rhomboid family intramembrane serine protease [candidate division NC10 bacterium]
MLPLRDNIPAQRFPAVTIGLIAANVAVFLYQYLLTPQSAQRMIFLYGLIPRELTSGVPLVPHPFPVEVTLFTSMFVHGGFFHVGGNMLYLWIFGNNVEDAMGHARFVLFYVLSGLAAAFSQVATGPNSAIPMVGASGAVSGVLGAYLLLYPHARVLTLITLGWFWRLVEIPALIVLGFWIVVQVLNGLLTFNFQGGGVAWFAHIGGFAAGMALLPFCKRRTVPVRLFRR